MKTKTAVLVQAREADDEANRTEMKEKIAQTFNFTMILYPDCVMWCLPSQRRRKCQSDFYKLLQHMLSNVCPNMCFLIFWDFFFKCIKLRLHTFRYIGLVRGLIQQYCRHKILLKVFYSQTGWNWSGSVIRHLQAVATVKATASGLLLRRKEKFVTSAVGVSACLSVFVWV